MRAAGGQVDFEALVENDGVFYKGIVEPEISGRERSDRARRDFVLDGVAGVQRWHGDVFFLVVGVFGSIARDTGRHFFHGVGGGGYDGAVFLFHAHETDVHYFVGGVVTEDQLAELLHSGITLHADADGEVASRWCRRFQNARWCRTAR